MSSSAPNCLARASLSSVEAVAITRAPCSLANWIAATATPPPAPSTRTVSLGLMAPFVTTIRQAVPHATGKQAAFSNE